MAPAATASVEKKQPTEASIGHSTVKHSPSNAQPFNKAKAAPPAPKPAPKPQQKPLTGRASKPIINWFQRKLAGTGRTKRADNHRAAAEAIALSKSRTAPGSLSPRVTPRVASSPVPSSTYPGGRPHSRHDSLAVAAPRKTISLNEDNIGHDSSGGDADENSLDQSSLAPESTWSPGSVLEADDDASVRPLPPSAPPSPSPSRSSSSYLSDPRTFRSIAASTKPTTLLSIDMNGNGMAHIAQAPTTSPTYVNRFPHIRNSSSTNNPSGYGSGASITFSSLPQSSSRPSSLSNPLTLGPTSQGQGTITGVQAPLHTTHHPRNNPRPSSPPLDNASVLTLASSAYAIPGQRPNLGHSATPSARGPGDSLSHFGGSVLYADAESTSQFVLGDDERLEERDVDASVRALRPRSSRRGSWESEASRWSARIQAGAGTPSLVRDRSLRTTNSIKTGAFSTENPETYDRSDDVDNEDEDQKERASQVDRSPVTGISIEPPSSGGESDSARNLVPNAGADATDIPSRPEAARKVSSDTVEQPNQVQESQESVTEARASNEVYAHKTSLSEKTGDQAAAAPDIRREQAATAG
ncbi:hypothetical protein LshimejAT787_0104990 [Lyophyllum shimeji]|uniref:Uncharacterized protein n=1 Tax=Lyophyllum shimeji TaxID=47721 RepID=A0A9P3PCU1_LYOSH|nr:hypothetical protein LshimejAT787_0104990 [Lyophyllum shimeji]